MKDIQGIEKALLDKELKHISEQLRSVGAMLGQIFEKYGKIDGRHGNEMSEYMQKYVVVAAESYFAGYTTRPQTNVHPDHVPECIKKLVLKWAVKDFMEKVEELNNMVSQS